MNADNARLPQYANANPPNVPASRKRHALGKHLPRKSGTARSKRHTYSYLMAARCGAGQHKAREIHARDQEHHARNGEQNEERFGETGAHIGSAFLTRFHFELERKEMAEFQRRPARGRNRLAD